MTEVSEKFTPEEKISKSVAEDTLWWKKEVIYQIYPRSFQDGDGDGIGDLKGILQRLDYLQWLGIKAIWISPIYPSPMADFGYDISDYRGIHEIFGDMDDFDELLSEVHRRDMKLILDLVPNHTSDQHPWFLESRSSRDNPKRDWYIWKDPKPDGSEPNNWMAMFGGTAWEWDEETQQYYYHGFLKEQPDLNWRNPEVQEAMFDVMRFWLDKGVDGFRVDVMWHMIKDNQFRNNPVNTDYKEEMPTYEKVIPVFSTDQPEVLDIVEKMRKVLDAYDERMMIGEIYLPIYKLVAYYGTDNNGAHLPFNFLLLSLPWDSQKIAAAIDEYEGALPDTGWPNWVLGNHDNKRIATRIGDRQARVAAVLLLTLRGTPTIYYGDEIGMRDVPIPPDEIKDPQGLNMPDKNLSRDPARTPMQWDDSRYAGFSDSEPWLRVGDNLSRHSVEAQKENKQSMLALYRQLIQLRQQEPALMMGTYQTVYADKQGFAYVRSFEGRDSFLIVLNFSDQSFLFQPKDLSLKGTLEVSTSGNEGKTRIQQKLSVEGNMGMLIRLEKP